MERKTDDARRPNQNLDREDFRNEPQMDGHRPSHRDNDGHRPPKGPRPPRRDFDDRRPPRPDIHRELDDRRPPRTKRPPLRGTQFKQVTKLFQDNKEMIEYVNEKGANGHQIDIFKIDDNLFKVVVKEKIPREKRMGFEKEL